MTVGNTPLVKLERVSKELCADVWAKCEFENPTGSFKDRGSVAEVREALRLNKSSVVCASTGNMAISLSFYARAHGLATTVVVPGNTPQPKLQKVADSGARILRVGGNYDQCVGVAEEIARNENTLLCGDYELRRTGQRSVGSELVDSGADAIVVPYGNGTLLVAIAEGLYKGGCKPMPQLIAARPVTANTIASACAVRVPLDGMLADTWIAKSGGCYIDVTDDEIKDAEARLCDEGYDVEYSAATSLAALGKIKNKFKSKKVVLILTGNNK